MNAILPDASVYVKVAKEIEELSWTGTDLLADIPNHGADAAKLASQYAEVATEEYECEIDATLGSTPREIVNLARLALVPRIQAEIDRREELVAAEYDHRCNRGRIDRNGCGDVPTYYSMVREGLV